MFRFTTLRATALTLAGSALLLLSNPVFAQESPQITPQQAQMLKQMKKGFRQSMGRDPTAEEEQQFLAAMGNTQIKLLGAIAGLTSAQFDRPPQASRTRCPRP